MIDLHGAVVAIDLDGTLVDTAPDLIGALNTVLETEGLAALPLSAARHLVGQGAHALLTRGFTEAGATWPVDRDADLNARFVEIYLDRIARESQPFPGVEAALDRLAAAGAALALCTNKRADLSLALLDALGLTPRFAAVLGGDYGGPMKPAGDLVLAAVAAAGGSPDRAVMVGDSDNDVLAARAAGVPSVVFTFGYCATPVADLGADAVLHAWSEAPETVARLLAPALRAPSHADISPPPRPESRSADA